MPFTRAEWNAIIAEVNGIRASPPADTDCEPLPAIDEVGLLHRWSKADIQAVQEALTETCPSITWDTIPELWKQSIIDEIEAKYAQAWCDCEDDDECDPMQEDGDEFVVYDLGGPQVLSDCSGYNTGDETVTACSLISGMTVGASGIYGRVWQLYRRDNGTDYVSETTGTVNCEGQVVCFGTHDLTIHYGTGVFCGGSCGTPLCEGLIADAEANLGSHPTQSSEYVLRVLGGDFCDEC